MKRLFPLLLVLFFAAPAHAEATRSHKDLAYAAYEKDDNATAVAEFKKHIAESKGEIADYQFWYRKGYSENAISDFTAALESLKTSLTYNAANLNTHLEIGFAHTKLRQADEAIAAFTRAREIDATSHIPTNGIAEVYRDVKKDCATAMTWYRTTLTIKADERKAHYGIGYCLNSMARFSEAIPHLAKAIEQEPTYVAAHVELGYAQFKSEDGAAAEASFKKAIELKPKHVNAHYYYGLLFVRRGDKANAQRQADELRPLNATHADTLQAKIDAM